MCTEGLPARPECRLVSLALDRCPAQGFQKRSEWNQQLLRRVTRVSNVHLARFSSTRFSPECFNELQWASSCFEAFWRYIIMDQVSSLAHNKTYIIMDQVSSLAELWNQLELPAFLYSHTVYTHVQNCSKCFDCFEAHWSSLKQNEASFIEVHWSSLKENEAKWSKMKENEAKWSTMK